MVAQLADKQLPDTPNEWFDWVNTSEKFLIEPYCPELETMEYRILYNVPKDSSSIFPIAHTQANTDFFTSLARRGRHTSLNYSTETT